MTDQADYLLPTWAPRVRKAKIAQLYKTAGLGIIDSDIVNEVGYAFYERCCSILEASSAVRGKVHCPNCNFIIEHVPWESEVVACAKCDWECPWEVYQKTYQRKNLTVGGLRPFIEEYVDKFPKERSPSNRLVLIDTLIHCFHWGGGRPGSANLIEGKLKDIMPFLDKLSYGDQIPGGVEATRDEWRQKWQQNKWKTRVEQMTARKRSKPK